ncbi:MAG: endonuclease/exonuclease/phosphatase family protein [Anaerolineales bacterium]
MRILTYKPDLVALQEVQPEMMSELEERLGDEYPYSLMGTQNDYGTTAVFSRYPVTGAYVLDLQADRPAVIVKTKINDQEITFVSVHLLAYNLWWTKLKVIPATVMERTFNQNRQASLVLGESRIQQGIVLIGCDCNSYETSSSYRILSSRLKNSAREVGWVVGGDVFPGTKQDIYLQHIDYVWYRGAINPMNVSKITDSGGSDHLPVLAVFEFQPSSR